MRIAQIAPLVTDIPPARLGPESIISFLTEELVSQGHDVTLFATAGSQTQALLTPVWPDPISRDWPEWVVAHVLMLEQVYKRAEEFDIIHNHVECLAAPLARRHKTATLSTLHSPIASDDWQVPIYEEYRELLHVAVSEFQRRHPMPWLNWQATIAYGLPIDLYPFQPEQGGYLAFFNRAASYQGLSDAVAIASRVGMKLKVAFSPEAAPGADSDQQTSALLDNPHVEYIGEIGDEQIKELLSQAFALIVPSTGGEPFELAAIEAMACGTPIIARGRGSLPEIVEDGVNGLMFETVADAARAIHRATAISRKRCREMFEERFSVQRMASEHIALYEKLIQ